MSARQQSIQFLIQYVHDRAQAEEVYRGLNKIGTGAKTAGIDIAGLAKRAALTIPVWLALRAAMMGVMQTIAGGIKHIREFDKAMVRAEVVTRGVADMAIFMKSLRVEIQSLAIETGKGVDEIAEAYYRFATSGLSAKEALEGMRVSLKTSIGMMGDTVQTARLLTDVYHLVGDTIEGATTVQEKFTAIGATTAVLWRNNTIELSEFIDGLKRFAATGANVNLTFDQMATMLAVSHTLMQRGTTAGTQLTRMFLMMLERKEEVQALIGPVDYRKDNMFEVMLEILTEVDAKFGDTAAKAATLINIFGIKGSGVALTFAQNLKEVVGEIDRVNKMPMAERIKEWEYLFGKLIKTVETQMNRMEQLRKVAGETFIRAITGTDDFVEALEKIITVMDNNVIPTLHMLGNNIHHVLIMPFKTLGNVMGDVFILIKNLVDILGGVWKAYEKISMAATAKVSLKEKAVLMGEAAKAGLVDIKTAWVAAEASQEIAIKGMTAELDKYFESWTKFVISPWELGTGRFGRPEGDASAGGDDAAKEAALRKLMGLSELGNLSLEKRLILTERLQALGYTDLEIKLKQLAILREFSIDLKEVEKKEEEVLSKMIDDVNEFSDVLKGAFEGAFVSMFSGEASFSEAFQKVGATIRETILKSLAGGVTSEIFKTTGIGEMFGISMFQLRGMFGGISGQLEAAHIEGITVGAQIIRQAHQEGMAGGVGASVYAGSGAVTLPGGQQLTLPGFGPSGFMSKEIPYKGQKFGVPGGPAGPMTYAQANPATYGQVAGAGFGSAMTGYSMYQAAGGAGGGGMAMASGITGAVGAAAIGAVSAGLLSVGAANFWNPVGWALLAASAVMMVMGSSKKKEQTSVEVQTHESRISSKIDISNKQLEIVNRNLVALRTALETYILPQSAYFSEKTNIEDEFALSSLRGFIGSS